MTPNIEIVAAVIHDEAANQGKIGMQAIAEVIRNRVALSGWRLTPVSIVQKPFQFQGYTRDGLKLIPKAKQSRTWKAALEVSKDLHTWCRKRSMQPNLAKGANHFASSVPWWGRGKIPVTVIGQHKFWKL